MAARMRYPEVAPEGYAALSAFGHYINAGSGLEAVLLGLVNLRASQLNGCEFCIALHRTELKKHNEPESRIDAVAQWDGNDALTPRERAALRWTELLTRLTGEPIPDADYQAVSVFFEGKALVDLSFAIANINAWNRMGLAFQPAWRPRHDAEVPKPPSDPIPDSAKTETSQPGPDSAQQAPTMQEAVDDDGGKVATN